MKSLLFCLRAKLFGHKLDSSASGVQLLPEESEGITRYIELAGEITTEAQIQNCLKGERFFVNDDDGNEEWLDAIPEDDFLYYYDIYDTIEVYGLPHGAGWLNEQEWLVYLYKNFKKTYELVKTELEIKAIKRNGKSPIND